MANAKYNSFKKLLMDGSINLTTASNLKVMLVTSAYTPDIDTHEFRTSVTNEVANGNGYTTGGATLTEVAVTKETTTDVGKLDAADVTWAASTITARGAVLYRNVGTAATDNLIAYFDFGADKSSSNGNFTIQWHTDGILTIG